MTRLNRNRVVEILRLVGCENLISQRKEFIFNAFVYFQPVKGEFCAFCGSRVNVLQLQDGK